MAMLMNCLQQAIDNSRTGNIDSPLLVHVITNPLDWFVQGPKYAEDFIEALNAEGLDWNQSNYSGNNFYLLLNLATILVDKQDKLQLVYCEESNSVMSSEKNTKVQFQT